MRDKTKDKLLALAALAAQGILGAIVLTASLVGFAALVEYVLSPALDRLLWGAWEAVNAIL